MKIKEIFELNNIGYGIAAGLILPVLSAMVIIPIGRYILMTSERLNYFDSRLFLLCLIPNLLLMRYNMVKVQREKTGKALLVITVLLVALFFVFIHRHPFNIPL